MKTTHKTILAILACTPLIIIIVPAVLVVQALKESYESEHNTDVG